MRIIAFTLSVNGLVVAFKKGLPKNYLFALSYMGTPHSPSQASLG